MRPALTIRRRAELLMAKLEDLLSRGTPKNNLEALRRNEEFMGEVELQIRGAIRWGMELMARQFDELPNQRMSSEEIAVMLRDTAKLFQGGEGAGLLGHCPACDRPHSEHARFFISEMFEVAVCLGLPANRLVMVGPDTAREFHRAAHPPGARSTSLPRPISP